MVTKILLGLMEKKCLDDMVLGAGGLLNVHDSVALLQSGSVIDAWHIRPLQRALGSNSQRVWDSMGMMGAYLEAAVLQHIARNSTACCSGRETVK